MANDNTAIAAEANNAALEFANYATDVVAKSYEIWYKKYNSLDKETGDIRKITVAIVRVYLDRPIIGLNKSGELVEKSYFDMSPNDFISQISRKCSDISMILDGTRSSAVTRFHDAPESEVINRIDVAIFNTLNPYIDGAKLSVSRKAIKQGDTYFDFNGNECKATRDMFISNITEFKLSDVHADEFAKIRMAQLAALLGFKL